MGYLIIRTTYKNINYISWTEDTNPISRELSEWLTGGVTNEILEYVPNIDPRTDPALIPQLNLWRDHLKGKEHLEQDQP